MNSGRFKLLMSTGLALLLVIQIAVFYGRGGMEKGNTGIFAIAIIVLAFSAVAVIYIVMKRIEKRVQNLSEEFRNFYIDSMEYVATTVSNRKIRNEISEAVLEILEHAYMENRNLDEVTGNDTKAFLEGFIAETGSKISKMFMFFYSTLLFVIYMLMMKVYFMVKAGGISFENLDKGNFDLGIILFYLIIAYLFFPWIYVWLRRAAAEKWEGSKRMKIFIPFSIPFGMVYLMIVSENKIFDYHVKVFNEPVIIVAMVLIALICIIGMKNNSRRKKII